MKSEITLSLRPSALIGITLFLLAAMPGHAPAAFILTLTQSGGNVVVNGSGTLNLSALNFAGNGSAYAYIVPQNEVLFSGPTSTTGYSYYQGGGLTGPASFGNGGLTAASSGTGSLVGIGGAVFVPQGYTSGTALTDSATFKNTTFTSLGFTPGTYTYAWGTGVNADSLTVTSVVPEPSTSVLFIAGGVLLLGMVLRHRRA